MISADEQLALAYAPATLRADCAALLGFDAALGQAFKATGEVGLIAIRLAWWRDQLGLKATREPIISALNIVMARHDVSADRLAVIIDGWAVLLDDPPYSDRQLEDYARMRGGTLYEVAARIAAAGDEAACQSAGAGWALNDFARNCSDRQTAGRAFALAREHLAGGVAAALPRSMLPFGILSRFAQSDSLRPVDQQRRAGSPMRAIEAICFALFRR